MPPKIIHYHRHGDRVSVSFRRPNQSAHRVYHPCLDTVALLCSKINDHMHRKNGSYLQACTDGWSYFNWH